MNGIKMSECKFYVNKDSRTVVCVIPEEINGRYTRNMVEDFIEDNFQFADLKMDWSLSGEFCRKLRMPKTFKGKAVCAPEDEWNEELGRKIAFARAKDKCYKSFFRRANLFVQTVDRRLGDMLDSFNNFGKKLEDKRTALNQQIEEKVR